MRWQHYCESYPTRAVGPSLSNSTEGLITRYYGRVVPQVILSILVKMEIPCGAHVQVRTPRPAVLHAFWRRAI